MMRALFIFLASALICNAQTDGRLIGAYLLPGYSTSNRAHDASGRNVPSIVSDNVTHIGGGTYYFGGGSAGKIQNAAPFVVATNTSFTVMMGFCVTNSNSSAAQDLFGEVLTNDVINTMEMAVYNSRLEFYIRCRVGAGNVAMDLVPPNTVLGAWRHAAFTFEKTTATTGALISIYLDGIQIGSSNNPAFTSLTGSLAQAFGMNPRATPVSTLTGMLERASFFVPALTSNEVIYAAKQWRATRP